MDANLIALIKESLFTILLIGGGFYIKVAKDKEPHASKNLWKIIITIGIIGFVLSLIKYFNKI